MDDQPKFYDVVELIPKQAEPVERERGQHHLNQQRLTGRLAFDLVAFQPIHVGSGMLLPPEALGLSSDSLLVKAFFRIGETLTLPGSSLKGAIRALVEMFTHSCVCKTTVRWKRDEENDYGECSFHARRHYGDLCPACKLFGAMGYQGQVRFDDAPQVEGNRQVYKIPAQYKPVPDRDYRRYYPYDLTDTREREWPLEVAADNARFAAQAQFTNLTQGELGTVLIALGHGEWKLRPRFGAGKSSGLGGMRVVNLVVQQWQTQKAYQAFDSNAWKTIDIKTCIQQAHSMVREDVLADLARNLGDTTEEGE